MDKILSIEEYIYQKRPDLLEQVKPEYENYLRFLSPSTFLQIGRTYWPKKWNKAEEWLLDDYDVYVDDKHTLSSPGIILHFTKTKIDEYWHSEKECWHTVEECFKFGMLDVTKKVVECEVGTHKAPIQWYWHPDHFKKDEDSWGDAIGLEFEHKSYIDRWDKEWNRHNCSLHWINAQYDEETDKLMMSKWNCLRLGADNTCWCVDIGCGRGAWSGDGRYEGRFGLREAKEQYLRIKSMKELTPIFTSLPEFNDKNLKIEL